MTNQNPNPEWNAIVTCHKTSIRIELMPFDPERPDQRTTPTVDLTMDRRFGGELQKAEVNWSAYGSVTMEQASAHTRQVATACVIGTQLDLRYLAQGDEFDTKLYAAMLVAGWANGSSPLGYDVRLACIGYFADEDSYQWTPETGVTE